MKTKLYLVRHGESEANQKHLLGGQTDFKLTKLGEGQAIQAEAVLRNLHFDKVYSSDLSRASYTAKIIYGKPVPRHCQLKDLRERTYGELNDQPVSTIGPSEVIKSSLTEKEKWLYRNVPGMETDQEMYDRFIKALKQIATDSMGKNVLVVAHGGPIRMVILKLTGIGHDKLPRGSFKNAGYVEIEYSNEGNFSLLHIEGADV